MFRLPLCFGIALPTLLLIVLYPVAIAGLTDLRRWVVWSSFWCFVIASGIVFQFNPQYVMAVSAAIIFSVLLGADVIERAFPQRKFVAAFIPLAIFALALHRICSELPGRAFYGPARVVSMNYPDGPASRVCKPLGDRALQIQLQAGKLA